jgi:uracil-DNA glycosylase
LVSSSTRPRFGCSMPTAGWCGRRASGGEGDSSARSRVSHAHQHVLHAAAEVAACKPILLRQIAVVDPDIIVLLGRVAEHALRNEPVLRNRRVLVHDCRAWTG